MNSFRKVLPFVGLLLVFVGLSIVAVFYSKGMLFKDKRLWAAYAAIAGRHAIIRVVLRRINPMFAPEYGP